MILDDAEARFGEQRQQVILGVIIYVELIASDAGLETGLGTAAQHGAEIDYSIGF